MYFIWSRSRKYSAVNVDWLLVEDKKRKSCINCHLTFHFPLRFTKTWQRIIEGKTHLNTNKTLLFLFCVKKQKESQVDEVLNSRFSKETVGFTGRCGNIEHCPAFSLGLWIQVKIQSGMGLKWFESAVFKSGLRKEQGLCSADSASGFGIAGPKDHERQLWGRILVLGYLIPTMTFIV